MHQGQQAKNQEKDMRGNGKFNDSAGNGNISAAMGHFDSKDNQGNDVAGGSQNGAGETASIIGVRGDTTAG